MVDVIWLSYHEETLTRGQWDDTFIGDLLSGIEYNHIESRDGIKPGKFAIVILHARMHVKDSRQINKDLAKLDSCVVMLVGDEASTFHVDQLRHPNMRLYVMHPRPEIDYPEGTRLLVNSYSPDTPLLKDYRDEYNEKPLDWFFAGQTGHARREECVEAIKDIPNGECHQSEGFTQGLPHDEYFKKLASAKFAPCPSGPETPDTFRLYEALEAGCIPIVDNRPSRKGYPLGFWEKLFGEVPPFPVLEEWASAPELIEKLLPDWKDTANHIYSWWQQRKRQYGRQIETDIFQLSGEIKERYITAMIPTSPSPVHPSTEMVTETIKSITDRLPNIEIIVQIDGCRPEQYGRRPAYQDYVRGLLWEANWEHQNVLPVVFKEYLHQSGKAKRTIDLVRTPYLLYVEHDTPLFDEIPFVDLLLSELGGMNLVRFSHEASILEPHKHMMVDTEPEDDELPLIRTMQWSQRPHLAKTVFYRWILSEYFGKESKTMIEWVMYGVQDHEWRVNGFEGWEKFRTAIYAAPGKDGIRRSANLDGRKNDPIYTGKFDYDGETPDGAPEPGIQ